MDREDLVVVPAVEVRWRHPRARCALTLSAAIAVLTLCVAGEPWILLLSLIASAILFGLSRGVAKDGPYELQLTRDGLCLAGDGAAHRVTREDARRAVACTEDERTKLVVDVRRGWLLEILLPPHHVPGLPAECIDRLGASPDQRAVEFPNPRAGSRLLTSWVLGALVGTLFVAAMRRYVPGGWSAAPTWNWFVYGSWALGALTAGRLSRTIDLTVGADGVAFRGPLRRWFVPYDTLIGVTCPSPGELLIHRTGRRPVRLTGTSLIDDAETRQAFVSTVERALAKHERRRKQVEVPSALARGDRTLAAWRDSLERLAIGDGAYRSPALQARDLEALVDDPSVDPELRVGAALAVRAMHPAEAPTRIRVAAVACANPATREALDRVADGTLDDRALDALERSRARIDP